MFASSDSSIVTLKAAAALKHHEWHNCSFIDFVFYKLVVCCGLLSGVLSQSTQLQLITSPILESTVVDDLYDDDDHEDNDPDDDDDDDDDDETTNGDDPDDDDDDDDERRRP
jgi:hypothetical protein